LALNAVFSGDLWTGDSEQRTLGPSCRSRYPSLILRGNWPLSELAN